MKFLPLTVKLMLGLPMGATSGVRLVISGTGLPMVIDLGTDSPPPGVGLKTVTLAVPVLETSLSWIDAFNTELLTYSVSRSEPFQRTLDPLTKLLPFTVRISEALPICRVAGSRLEIVGTGLVGVDEVEKLRIKAEISGIVLKTDTLGSLEAVTEALSRHDVQIRLADIGDVSRRDVVEAEAASEEDRLLAVVLAFNVRVLPDAEEEAKMAGIPIFQSDIIYHMIEDYLRWSEEQRTAGVKAELDALVRPCKAKIMTDLIFRRSKPAIVGVEILSGRLKPKLPIISSSGRKLGALQRIQDKGNDVQEALAGMQVAVSIEDGVVGRNISEGDVIYTDVPERHLKKLTTKFPGELTESDQETIKELVQIKRRENPVWGL